LVEREQKVDKKLEITLSGEHKKKKSSFTFHKIDALLQNAQMLSNHRLSEFCKLRGSQPFYNMAAHLASKQDLTVHREN